MLVRVLGCPRIQVPWSHRLRWCGLSTLNVTASSDSLVTSIVKRQCQHGCRNKLLPTFVDISQWMLRWRKQNTFYVSYILGNSGASQCLRKVWLYSTNGRHIVTCANFAWGWWLFWLPQIIWLISVNGLDSVKLERCYYLYECRIRLLIDLLTADFVHLDN